MKKLIILTISVILISLLLGCGISNRLEDTKWQFKEIKSDFTVTTIFELKENGDLFITITDTRKEKSTFETGKWFSIDNKLFFEGDLSYAGYYDVEIKKDEMFLIMDSYDIYFKLTRVK